MKKSFLIFGVMGALCATNGWAQDEASDTLSRAAKVTQRIEKVEASNVNALSADPEVKDTDKAEGDTEKVKPQAGFNCLPKYCCKGVWHNNGNGTYTTACKKQPWLGFGKKCESVNCGLSIDGEMQIEQAQNATTNQGYKM